MKMSPKTILTVSVLLIPIFQTIDAEFNCSSNTNNNCTCLTLNTGFHLSCPNLDEPLVSIQGNGKILDISCTNLTDYVLIPNVSIGEMNKVLIQKCYIPDSFEEDIVKTLDLRQIETFVLDMCVNPSDCLQEELVVTNKYMRGLETVRVLQMRKNFIVDIEKDAFKNIPNLEMIDFYFNNLTKINKIFDYTPLVKRIDLSGNHINEIMDGVFDNVPKLKVLYLNSNKLIDLRPNLFLKAKNITILELSSNQLHRLPENLFNSLINLTQVSLAINNLEELPEGLFYNSRILTHIRLSRNKIKKLPANIFRGLNRLEDLDLSGNLIETIPDGLFKDLVNLNKLNIAQNLVKSPTSWFVHMRSLNHLDLSRNRISKLENDFFDGLENLKHLSLENNRLTTISGRLRLKKVETLHMQQNNISDIISDAFYDMKNLRKLDMSFNNLSALDLLDGITPFNCLIILEELYLRNNSISDFYGDFVISTKIRKLDLSHNVISSISLTDVKTTSEDATINLEYNKIETVDFAYWEQISDDLENDGSVTTVLLSENPIACDCRAYHLSRYFHKLINTNLLYRFKLKFDDLKCASPIESAGRNVTSLNPYELTCDYKQSCPEKCFCKTRPWDDCFIIDCSDRNLTVPPSLSSRMPQMKQIAIHLEDNSLEEFPGQASGYENVTDLYLQNNRLNSITWVPPKVEVLDLQENNLTVLDYNVLSILNDSTSLTNLSLHNNPWSCDCSTATVNFAVALRENLIRKITVENLTCSDSNLNLIHMTNDELCKTNTTMIIILGACLFTILITLTLAMALYYKYNQEIKIWLYSHNLFPWFITEEDLDKEKMYDAFVSYSHEDEDFVIKHLQPKLEGGNNPYKLCLHDRDWEAGDVIATQIVRSVQNSRRTIIVLSPNFIESNWSVLEFRTAHTEAVTEGRTRVIVILYKDININDDLDEELKAYLKTNTYLKWGDPLFWEKLKHALPHGHNNGINGTNNTRKKNKKMDNIMVTIEKMDLINSPATPNVGTPPAISLDPLLLKGNPLTFKSNKIVA